MSIQDKLYQLCKYLRKHESYINEATGFFITKFFKSPLTEDTILRISLTSNFKEKNYASFGITTEDYNKRKYVYCFYYSEISACFYVSYNQYTQDYWLYTIDISKISEEILEEAYNTLLHDAIKMSEIEQLYKLKRMLANEALAKLGIMDLPAPESEFIE